MTCSPHSLTTSRTFNISQIFYLMRISLVLSCYILLSFLICRTNWYCVSFFGYKVHGTTGNGNYVYLLKNWKIVMCLRCPNILPILQKRNWASTRKYYHLWPNMKFQCEITPLPSSAVEFMPPLAKNVSRILNIGTFFSSITRSAFSVWQYWLWRVQQN